MEGKFSGEGLQALDTDEDLMSAMARELVEKGGVGESADAVWRELDHERDKVLPRPTLAEPLPAEEPAPVLDLPIPIAAPSVPATFGTEAESDEEEEILREVEEEDQVDEDAELDEVA
jgi:hypothetical protein